MLDIHALVRPFEAWSSLYSHSTALSATVATLHVGGMFLGGGLAIAADRATLRLAAQLPGERARHLVEVSDVHPPVLIGIAVLFVTGIAMALADLENYLPSPAFWTKMTLVVLLLVNGVFLQRTEAALRRESGSATADMPARWRQMRRSSMMSLVLWIATFVAGSVLTKAA